MPPVGPVEIEVDFNYGGRRGGDGAVGAVFLSPKKGKRTGLRPDIVNAFAARGARPQLGSPVRMIDRRATADDAGRPLDMVVDGVLVEVSDDMRCYATYDWDAVVWVSSVGEEDGPP